MEGTQTMALTNKQATMGTGERREKLKGDWENTEEVFAHLLRHCSRKSIQTKGCLLTVPITL